MGKREGGKIIILILFFLSTPISSGSEIESRNIFERLSIGFYKFFSPEENFQGRFSIAIEDPGRVYYVLESESEVYELDFGEDPEINDNAMLSVNGNLIGNTIEVNNYEIISEFSSGIPLNTGVKNIAFVRVKFQDNLDELYPKEEAEDFMRKADLYYQDISYGKASLNSEIFDDYYILGGNANSGNCDPNGWREQLLNGQGNIPDTSGINWAQYDLIIMSMPQTSCFPWYGLYSLGFIWLNGPNGFDLHTIVHEIGHDFGVYHASDYECGGKSTLEDIRTCPIVQYGDTIEVMGAPLISKTENTGDEYAYEMSILIKDIIGWIDEGEVAEIRFGERYGIYEIGSVENPGNYLKGIKAQRYKKISEGDIPRLDGFYYIEYRTNIEADSNIDPEWIDGVLVRTDHRIVSQALGLSTSSQLIDFTPYENLENGGMIDESEQYPDSDDSVLREGESYWDEVKFFIKVLDINEERAVVLVQDFEACNTSADENCDGNVDNLELAQYVEKYRTKKIHIGSVSDVISEFLQG